MKYVFPKYYEKLEEFNKEVYHQLIAIGAGETLYFEYFRESYEILYPIQQRSDWTKETHETSSEVHKESHQVSGFDYVE